MTPNQKAILEKAKAQGLNPWHFTDDNDLEFIFISIEEPIRFNRWETFSFFIDAYAALISKVKEEEG